MWLFFWKKYYFNIEELKNNFSGKIDYFKLFDLNENKLDINTKNLFLQCIRNAFITNNSESKSSIIANNRSNSIVNNSMVIIPSKTNNISNSKTSNKSIKKYNSINN